MQSGSPASKYFPSTNENSKTWVLFMRNNVLGENGSDVPCIVKLRHPRRDLGAMFLFSSDNCAVQEIFMFSEKRSWFINDSVQKDGHLYFSTPIDPLFLILPYLKKSVTEGKTIPLEDLLVDSEYPETYRLLKLFTVKNLSLLADRKGPEDLNVWLYNEEKAIKWLHEKVERVFEVLKFKNINVSKNGSSTNFVKVIRDEADEKQIYLRYAHEIVSEYIPNDLSIKLLSSLGLPEESPKISFINKRKLKESSDQIEVKKLKMNEEDVVTPLKSDKLKSLSGKKKEKSRAESGMKSITFFFKKK